MPNYCYCSLSFEGDEKDINTLKAKISSTDDNGKTIPIDFSQVIPMPPELNISHQSDAELLFEHQYLKKNLDRWEQKLLHQMNDEQKKNALLLAKQYYDNYKKHGHSTWYEWSIEHWGTKWNAMKSHDEPSDTNPRFNSEATYFMTAWSPPIPVIQKLSKIFPKLFLILKFRDEFQKLEDTTTLVFENGVITKL